MLNMAYQTYTIKTANPGKPLSGIRAIVADVYKERLKVNHPDIIWNPKHSYCFQLDGVSYRIDVGLSYS